MKQLLPWTVIISLTTTPAFAVNPVQGLYAGITLGGTYTPSLTLNFIHPTLLTPVKGSLTYSVLGNIAGQVGYRMKCYRMEAELLYNGNPYSTLQVGNFIVHNSNNSPGVRMKGLTSTGAIMANGFYDFLPTGDGASFAPYLGLGIGYATVRNNVKFYNNNVYIPDSTFSRTATTPAAQGILGASYFLDDYTSFALDYRYFSTKSVQPFDSRVQLNSVNLTFNGSF